MRADQHFLRPHKKKEMRRKPPNVTQHALSKMSQIEQEQNSLNKKCPKHNGLSELVHSFLPESRGVRGQGLLEQWCHSHCPASTSGFRHLFYLFPFLIGKKGEREGKEGSEDVKGPPFSFKAQSRICSITSAYMPGWTSSQTTLAAREIGKCSLWLGAMPTVEA